MEDSPSYFDTTPCSSPTMDKPHTLKSTRRDRILTKISCETLLPSFFAQISKCVELVGAQRLEPTERCHNIAGFWSAFQFWAGCNVTPLNVILGILAIFRFQLKVVEAFTIILIASIVGSTATGAIARYGPRSGLRTMMMSRFTYGWHDSRVICVLNALMLAAFLVVDSISCRDIMLTLVPNNADVAVIVVVGLGIVAIVAAATGGATLDIIGRWSWRPQLVSMAVLAGGCLMEIHSSDRPSAPVSTGTSPDKIHLRIGYGALVCNAVLVFSMAGADFSHAFAEGSPPWKVTLGPTAGLATSHVVLVTAGVVIGEAARIHGDTPSTGLESPAALVGRSFQLLGPLGTLCAVCFVLGSFGAISAGMYVAAIPLGPMLHRYDRWTRVASTTVIGVVVIVCTHCGRGHLTTIAQSIVSIIGSLVLAWWVPSMIDMEFRRNENEHWLDWNASSRLPCRPAALLASLTGSSCAILAVNQPWYTGPIAGVVGPAKSYVR